MQAERTGGWWKGAGRTKEREVQAWQRRMGFISRWASRPAPDSPAWFTGLQCGNPWFIVAEWRARECCASNPGPYHSWLFHTLPLSATIHKMFSYLSSCLRQFFKRSRFFYGMKNFVCNKVSVSTTDIRTKNFMILNKKVWHLGTNYFPVRKLIYILHYTYCSLDTFNNWCNVFLYI